MRLRRKRLAENMLLKMQMNSAYGKVPENALKHYKDLLQRRAVNAKFLKIKFLKIKFSKTK